MILDNNTNMGQGGDMEQWIVSALALGSRCATSHIVSSVSVKTHMGLPRATTSLRNREEHMACSEDVIGSFDTRIIPIRA